MKAINLIPADERKGGGGAARSGGAVYFLLGGLGIVLVVVAAFALVSKQAADREERLGEVQAEVSEVRAQAAALKPYGDFARLAVQRVATVQTLADARVDWRRVLDELARAIPADVRLTKLDAKKAGDAAAGAAGAAAPGGPPSLTLDGCAPDQEVVAGMLVKLGQLSGAGDVNVTKSVKGRGSAGTDGGCGLPYSFTATVAFGPEGSAPATPGGAPAPPPATPPAGGGQAGAAPEGEVQNSAPPAGEGEGAAAAAPAGGATQ